MAGTAELTSRRTEGVIRREVITLTADAADGSFPATTLKALGVFIDGTLLAIKTNPGATAPTDNLDFTLVDADGIDRLNSVGLNRDTTTSEIAAVTGAPFFAIDDALTLTVTGNSVNSAIEVVTLLWSPTASSTAAAGGVGGGDASAANQVTGNASLSDIATAVQIIDNIVSGSEAQVDVVGALPAGTNAIGYLYPPQTLTTSQVAPTTTAGTAVVARSTRRIVNIRNVGSVDVYLGPATVTTANGYKLAAGEAKDFISAALIQAITASGTGAVHCADEY